MGFPTQVNTVPALGVPGDFCDTNPRASVDNQQGAFVAGALGVLVGRFAWADAANRAVNNFGPGAPTGFVARAQQALITEFLGEATQRVPVGLPIVLHSSGGFWVRNAGATAVTIGQTAYANNVDGSVSFAAAGTPTAGGTSTASTIAATTSTASTLALNSFTTSSISGTTLTIGAVATGGAFVGQTISGGAIVPGTTILEQLTGTANGAGTYRVSISQNIASTTITGSGAMLTVGGTVTGYYAVGQTITGSGVTAGSTILARGTGVGVGGTYFVSAAQTVGSQAINATGGLLTVGGTVTGTFATNDLVTGSGISAGTYIVSPITGTGGAGTYLVNNGQTIASQAINVNANTETKFIALSTGAVGELIKMSSHKLG